MITSTANPQVKTILQLQKKARERKKQQLYVVEGIRMFREAPDERIARIYLSASFAQGEIGREIAVDRRSEILADSVFAHVSDTKTPQGILCLVRMDEGTFAASMAEETGLWLILENIQDPGNLGTMFRTGEGAGVTGILMDKNTVDIYNPKTIRSTMGSIYRVPFVIAEDFHGAIGEMQSRGIRVYAAHLGGSVCYDEPDYRRGSAFLIGNEGNGLTAETAALADQNIRIPMAGQLESLNAAMAGGILLYEAARQRRQAPC